MTRVSRAAEPGPRPRVPRSEPWLALVAFLAPATLWMDVVVVGRLYAPELILAALLPFLLLARGRMLADPLPRTFLVLAALWLAGQVVTDVVRETEFRDYARGWSRIGFTVVNFCALYLLLHGSRRRLVLFALGLVAGGCLAYLASPSELARIWPWKFGLGTWCAVLAALIGGWRPIATIPLLPALPLALVAAYSVAVGARALAGVAFIASLYILAQQLFQRRAGVPAPGSLARMAFFCAAAAVLAAGLLRTYEVVVAGGFTDERSVWLTEWQREGTFGLLLGGRSEIFASGRAVMDRPILGHGSWAKNPDYAARILDARLHGYDMHFMSHFMEDLIPTHSHFMGAWVEAGILGTFLWFWALFLVLRVLSNLYLAREPLGPLIAFAGFLLLWDIPFSPFGAERRLTVPFHLVLLMFAWDVLRGRLPRAAAPRYAHPPPPPAPPSPPPPGSGLAPGPRGPAPEPPR